MENSISNFRMLQRLKVTLNHCNIQYNSRLLIQHYYNMMYLCVAGSRGRVIQLNLSNIVELLQYPMCHRQVCCATNCSMFQYEYWKRVSKILFLGMLHNIPGEFDNVKREFGLLFLFFLFHHYFFLNSAKNKFVVVISRIWIVNTRLAQQLATTVMNPSYSFVFLRDSAVLTCGSIT